MVYLLLTSAGQSPMFYLEKENLVLSFQYLILKLVGLNCTVVVPNIQRVLMNYGKVLLSSAMTDTHKSNQF